MPVVTWLNPGEGVQTPVRFTTRLRAWWEGYDLSVLQRLIESGELIAAEAGDEQPASPPPQGGLSGEPQGDLSGEPLGGNGKPLWTAERVAVAEQLWGQDFLSPGGIEHTTYLVKPFGINPSMSILDLNAGLGGVARTIARDYRAWVTGLEPSALIAQMGGERSAKEKLGKQAPVLHYDPENLKLDKKYDGIFAKEAFFTFGNKDKLFNEIAAHMKEGGQFLFTDYCVEEPAALARLEGWIRSEPVTPVIWGVGQIVKALRARKFDVRVSEDMTPLQRQLILSSLGNFLQHLDAHKLTGATKLAVLDEVELWARRMAAFDHGLKVYRFYCMRR